ncbi:MAG: hypothetical protein KDI90_07250 [Alphaproteobacteria bacterium]|nr:hypothetical protein [Alphaproteobacteria bacterium]MCB9974208.1 hypothetical protein [Rhodospirillales bacterium]
MTILTPDLVWWITVIDLPAMAGLFWLIWKTRNEGEQAVSRLRLTLDYRSEQFREALNAFKLEVAKNYASQHDLRALETRLVNHLLRIESKLDATALKAESLRGAQTRSD